MIAIKLSLSQQSQQVIQQWKQSPARLARALEEAVERVLVLAENNVMRDELSNTYQAGERRNGQGPLAIRSGALRASITHQKDEPLSGYVGVAEGPASTYARTVLGDKTTTIKPKNANHLWVPLKDNLTNAGNMRLSPSAAFEKQTESGKTRLQIFESKAGNLVAFLREPGKFKRGARKGMQRGKLLFVLKDQVEVKGTDGLAKGVAAVAGEAQSIFNQAIESALPGGAL